MFATMDAFEVGALSLPAIDLSELHLARIRNVIFDSAAKFIFIPAAVRDLLKKTKLFVELGNSKRESCGLKVLFEDGHRTVF